LLFNHAFKASVFPLPSHSTEIFSGKLTITGAKISKYPASMLSNSKPLVILISSVFPSVPASESKSSEVASVIVYPKPFGDSGNPKEITYFPGAKFSNV